MNKQNILKFVYFVLCIPGSFAITFLVSRLFYLCPNEKILYAMVLTTFILSWLLARRMKGNNPEIIKVLVLSGVFVVLFFVVLASMNHSREAGPSAAIKMSNAMIRSQAEIFYTDNNHSYEGLCLYQKILSLKEEISKKQRIDSRRCLGPILEAIIPEGNTSTWFSCRATDKTFVVESYLPTSKSYFCVDSTGNALSNDGSVGSSMTCE